MLSETFAWMYRNIERWNSLEVVGLCYFGKCLCLNNGVRPDIIDIISLFSQQINQIGNQLIIAI